MLYATLKDNLSIVFVVVAVIVALWYYRRKEHFDDGSEDSLQSHSQLLFKSMNDISRGLRVELDRTKDIDDRLIETSDTSNRNLKTIMTGTKIGENSRDNIDANIARGRGHVDDTLTLTEVAKSAWDTYNVNPQQILNDYQFGNKMLRTHIENAVNEFLGRRRISLDDSERSKLYAIVYNAYIKFMDRKGVNEDISRLYADTSIYVKDSGLLESLMTDTVQNIVNEQNKRVSLSAKNPPPTATPPPTFKIGEFVFFKHVVTVSARSGDVCADDGKTNTMVVGGKICSVDNVRKTVKIKYSFIMNPNYNQRCTRYESASGRIDYSKVDTYPVWYMQCNEKDGDCCDAPNVPKKYKFSCDRAKMSEAVANMPNNFIKTYIGGHSPSVNGYVEYSCGVSPTGYNFPSDVSMRRLFRTIEDCLVGKEAEYEIPVADTQRV